MRLPSYNPFSTKCRWPPLSYSSSQYAARLLLSLSRFLVSASLILQPHLILPHLTTPSYLLFNQWHWQLQLGFHVPTSRQMFRVRVSSQQFSLGGVQNLWHDALAVKPRFASWDADCGGIEDSARALTSRGAATGAKACRADVLLSLVYKFNWLKCVYI